MARSPLFRTVRRLLQRAHAERLAKLPPDERPAPRGPSRRDVFRGLGAAAVIAPLAAACGDNSSAIDTPPIAIIGGGMAGLSCAFFLQLGGVRADVFEASMRVGGRMWTQREGFGEQVIELGGELVDSDHVVMRAFATEFGLQLDDLVAATDGLKQDIFHFNGAELDEGAIITAFEPVAQKMTEANEMGELDDVYFEMIDQLSIPQWLEQEAGLAPGNVLKELLEVAYLEEFGLEVAEQSAWNLLTLIDYTVPVEEFLVFGGSDERFHFHGGNDLVTDALRARIAEDQVTLDHALTKVAQVGDQFDLTFMTSGGEVTARAQHVVYALPFTKLREVDLADSGLTDEKKQIITELGYGTNAKLMLGFTERNWETAHASGGGVITDIGQLQTIWATSRGQDGETGVLTNFVGGQRGLDINSGTAESQAQMVLPWIDTVFPGTSATYVANSAVRQHWPSYPFAKGSYASYKVGQWAFFGLEGKAEGNQHFCGEHCSEDYQGYMEGAAETGALVAAEILDGLGIAQPPLLAGLLGMLATRPRASYHGGFGEKMRITEIRKR